MFKLCYLLSILAPYRLPGGNAPDLLILALYKSFVCLLDFLDFTFLTFSFFILSSLLIFPYSFSSLFSSRIDPFLFEASVCSSLPNLTLVF